MVPKKGVDVEMNALARVLAEYRDMRGLRLTTRQAARLWALSLDDCHALLEALVAAGHLYRDADGQFALRTFDGRSHAEPVVTPFELQRSAA